jgi:hypothetical protein
MGHGRGGPAGVEVIADGPNNADAGEEQEDDNEAEKTDDTLHGSASVDEEGPTIQTQRNE